MAFPIPEHLPRKVAAKPQDVSSEILTKIGETSKKSLNSALASSWLEDLETTIQVTRDRIHDRIHADLPQFEQQLEMSKSVQTRLHSLTHNVEILQERISDQDTGLIPSLVRSLTAHSQLSQAFSDAHAMAEGSFHLKCCISEYSSFSSLVQEGQLPDAARAASSLESTLARSPEFLSETDIMKDLRRKFQALKARTEEQLSQAYSRSITISPSTLSVKSTISIPPSSTVLDVSAVLSSLSPTALSEHLKILRRDFVSYYVDGILKGDAAADIDSDNGILTRRESSPESADLSARLDNLSNAMHFLSGHFLSMLPPPQSTSFPISLCKPISDSVLNNVLISSIPSSFSQLPAFLGVVEKAVDFEQSCIIGLLKNDVHDTLIKTWADGVSGHYERKRRVEILDEARRVILDPSLEEKTFMAKWQPPKAQVEIIPVQYDVKEEGAAVAMQEDDAWGFEDENGDKVDPVEGHADEADGWGLDDEEDVKASTPPVPEEPARMDDEPDPSEAWGWDDETGVDAGASATGDDTAWDDPWGSEEPSPSATSPKPKVASKLEKLANKGKKKETKANGASSSPPPPSPPQVSRQPPVPAEKRAPVKEKKPLAPLQAVSLPKETYLVSGRMTELLKMVDRVLSEGDEFVSSNLCPTGGGSVILQSAPSILDLFRALYPTVFGSRLDAMRYSNDCLYLHEELGKIESRCSPLVKERITDSRARLRVLRDSWSDDAIEGQRRSLNRILEVGGQGFADTGDQERYDECESAVNEVLQNIRSLSRRWKGMIAKSKYYAAIGSVTDAALEKVLGDVLALPDIPEVESKRLGELCRILNALEGIFVEDPAEPSFVVSYVPLWLKFSYLSELLEASLVDIAYLFETGALVDFETDELVRLVQALFSDTQMRTNLINKIRAGQPIQA